MSRQSYKSDKSCPRRMAKDVELWPGEHPSNFLPDGQFFTRHGRVLDSIANYYDMKDPHIPYRYEKLFLDNGAYAASRHHIRLDPEKVKDLQEKFRPDQTIPLDYPFLPGMSKPRMVKRWRMTQRNMLDWYETTNLPRILPALHAWSPASLRGNLKWLAKYADSDMIALGSIVGKDFAASHAFFGDRFPNKALIDMLIESVHSTRKITDFSLHMMGFGSSPFMLHLGFFCGLSSTDTTGYRRGAAFGKILIPGGGWRSVGKKRRSFRIPPPTRTEFETLSKCRCSVCREDQSLLFSNWKARAVHNKHLLQREESRARRLIEAGLEEYEKYVTNLFRGSRAIWLRSLWEYARSNRGR